ncbi:hypothetical protein RM549_06155 [Salegentibacter sp. F188]|uniref:Uncharacterized protein n=1 Tax=Autumnicola patrickiae TaxID=3075591 RepID=A0ABU3E046_9FLAO|nr:hypothetical protein [Salegentibacter sp. F188]MDT0689360.1 hypothetical protein [Salegentibacter sp. F188]
MTKNVNYVVVSELPILHQAPFTEFLKNKTLPTVEKEKSSAICAPIKLYRQWLNLRSK